MKRKGIEFKAEDLVASVEALAHHASGQHKLTLRTNTLTLPPRIKPLKDRRKVGRSHVIYLMVNLQ